MIYKSRATYSDIELIVLSCNALKITKQFLDLLYKNTKDFTIVMIDNGSQDGTPEYLKTFADQQNNMTLVLNDTNLGVIGGRNQGYSISCTLEPKSKYILILDNDQFVQEGWLAQHMDFLKKGYDIVGVEAWQMDRNFYPFKKNSNINEPFSYSGCGGSLIKREVIEKIGLFDDRFNPSYFEDPDFCFRAIDAGYKIGWNANAKVVHLPHQTLGSIADRNQRFQNSFLKFREKWKGRKNVMISNKI